MFYTYTSVALIRDGIPKRAIAAWRIVMDRGRGRESARLRAAQEVKLSPPLRYGGFLSHGEMRSFRAWLHNESTALLVEKVVFVSIL